MAKFPIMAQLKGSNVCIAEGITVTHNAPALEMCRRLVEAGVDPEKPLVCFRSGEIAVKICSIGWGAKHAVDESQNGPKVTAHRPDHGRKRAEGGHAD